MFDFALLEDSAHMLEWLADEPYQAIILDIEDMLLQQVADSKLTDFRVISEPQWLTGAKTIKGDEEHVILVRCGIAFEFNLQVQSQGQTHHLQGIYSWVGTDLDDDEKREQNSWMDLNGSLEHFGANGELKQRIYKSE